MPVNSTKIVSVGLQLLIGILALKGYAQNPEADADLNIICVQDLCAEYKKKYPETKKEFTEFEYSLQKTKLTANNLVNTYRLKNKINNDVKFINSRLAAEAMTKQSGRPESADYNFEANFALANTDCESVSCSPKILKLTQLYQQVDSSSADHVYLISTKSLEEQRIYLKELLEKINKSYPESNKLIPKSNARLLELIPQLKLHEVHYYIRINTNYLQMKNDPVLKTQLEVDPPSLAQAWGSNLSALQDSSKDFDKHIEVCRNNIAEHLAYLPTDDVSAMFTRAIGGFVKKDLLNVTDLNFPGKCARAIRQKWPETITIKAMSRQSVEADISNFFRSQFLVTNDPLATSSEKKLTAYWLYRNSWLENECIDPSQLNMLIDYNNEYDPNTHEIHVSSKTIRRDARRPLGHEMGHSLWRFMLVEPDCKAQIQQIHQCLERKNKFGNRIKSKEQASEIDKNDEDVADLFGAAENLDSFCGLISDSDLSSKLVSVLDEKSEENHSSFLFRLLHSHSLKGSQFPNSCSRYLEKLGQADLFNEKCFMLKAPVQESRPSQVNQQ